MRSRVLYAVSIAALTLAVYVQVVDHDFVDYDDRIYIVENPWLPEGLTPANALRAFTTPYETNWIPLTWISLQASYELHGLEPAGYLLTNVALHTASGVLLFLLLAGMTGAVGRSAFVAAVFAIHPLHVESVAWASERKDALSGLFFMLTLLAWAHYAARPGRARMLWVSLALALGLLAKPMLVTAPFVLLLLDGWPLGRLAQGGWRRAALEKLPLFALAAAAATVTFVVQRALGVMPDAEALSLASRLGNALDAAAVYLGQFLWPRGLAVFYPHPEAGLPAGRVAAAALTLLTLSAVVVWQGRARPYLWVGWLWYLGMLVPVIGLVQVGSQAHADRYMYLPLIGPSILLAWGAVDLAGARAQRALAGLAVAAVGALSWSTFQQVGSWRDTTTLFERAAAVTQDNFLAHKVLGDTLMRQGRPAEAQARYAEAVRLRPDWAPARLALADALRARGEHGAAVAAYRRGLRLVPGDARGRAGLGLALIASGRPAEALPELERALALGPDSAELETALGIALERVGRRREAADHYRSALRLAPGLVSAANNLAWLLATSADAALGDPEEAIRVARAAVAALPQEEPGVLDTLAAAYAAGGRFGEAVAAAERGAALALARGEAALAQQIRERERLYRSGRPYREAPASDP